MESLRFITKGGDEFNGLVFVKFISGEKRSAAILKFNAAKIGLSGNTLFMSPDLPYHERVGKKFLNDLKKLLVGLGSDPGWGFAKGNVRFDESTMILRIEGIPVAKAVAEEFKFDVIWLQPSWAQWSELTGDAKFKQIDKAAQSKLDDAKKRLGKGKGKSA